jgi:hypothetical protein
VTGTIVVLVGRQALPTPSMVTIVSLIAIVSMVTVAVALRTIREPAVRQPTTRSPTEPHW